MNFRIRDAKKQARQILHKNYKSFLFPVLLCIFSVFARMSFLYAFNDENIFKAYPFLTVLFLVLLLFFDILVYPISIYLIVKVSAILTNENTDKDKNLSLSFLFKDVKKIFLIWLLPSIIHSVNSLLDGYTEYKNPVDSIALPLTLISFTLSVISFCLSYKFFICNYIFALNGGTVKETISFSFETMNGKLLKYISLTLSFILWYLLVGILLFIFGNFFRMNTYPGFLLNAFGCGVYLYLYPYMHLTESLYIKNNLLSPET